MASVSASVTAIDRDEADGDALTLRNLGVRLRQFRAMRNLSLAELSARAGVSVAMISHIERGQASPSIRTLDRIRRALGVSLSALFVGDSPIKPEDRRLLVRRGDRPTMDFKELGIFKELLTPAIVSNMEILIFTLSSGGNSGMNLMTRTGEKAGLILSGRFGLIVGDRSYELEEGDSFQFDSSIPHRFRNLADGETKVLYIIKADDAV